MMFNMKSNIHCFHSIQIKVITALSMYSTMDFNKQPVSVVSDGVEMSLFMIVCTTNVQSAW